MKFDGNWLHALTLLFFYVWLPLQVQINSGLVRFLRRALFSFLFRLTCISCLLCPAKRAVVQMNALRKLCQLSTLIWSSYHRCSLSDCFSIFSPSMADMESYQEYIFIRAVPPAVVRRKSTGRFGWGKTRRSGRAPAVQQPLLEAVLRV